jgi:hypothetical protein
MVELGFPVLINPRHPWRRRLAGREPAGRSPNLLHVEAGGDEERRRFLSDVASEASRQGRDP